MKKRFIPIFTILFSLLFFTVAFAETLQIYFLDVGQGDSSLIIASTGEVVLIDSGQDENIILTHLKKIGIIISTFL